MSHSITRTTTHTRTSRSTTHTHTHTHTHKHKYTHKYKHTHTQKHTQTQTPHKCTHTHTHTHTHHTHTNTHTHHTTPQSNSTTHLMMMSTPEIFVFFLLFILRAQNKNFLCFQQSQQPLWQQHIVASCLRSFVWEKDRIEGRLSVCEWRQLCKRQLMKQATTSRTTFCNKTIQDERECESIRVCVREKEREREKESWRCIYDPRMQQTRLTSRAAKICCAWKKSHRDSSSIFFSIFFFTLQSLPGSVL